MVRANKAPTTKKMPRCRLRPLRISDGKLLYQWITDRELVLFNAAYHPVSEVDHKAWLRSVMTKRSDLVIFAIETLPDKQTIGTCQLLHINTLHRSAELQIRIGVSGMRGKGLGQQAVRQLLDYGFKDLNLHRIELRVFATNHRAIRAYEASGFCREGVARQAVYIDGAYVDVVHMGILRDEHV